MKKENTQQSTTTRWSKVIMGGQLWPKNQMKTKQKYTTINHNIVMRSSFLHHWSVPYWLKKRRWCIWYSRYVFDELFLPGISLATLKINLFLFRTSILSQNNVWTSCFVICYISHFHFTNIRRNQYVPL